MGEKPSCREFYGGQNEPTLELILEGGYHIGRGGYQQWIPKVKTKIKNSEFHNFRTHGDNQL